MNSDFLFAAVLGSLLVAGPSAAAQASNDAPFNNGGDVLVFYSSPSSGFSSLAIPPDLNGDLYWRAHGGAAFLDDVDPLIGSAMEIDGYFEVLFDTDWTTSPSFYARSHGPALPDSGGLGGLEPAFFQLGFTTEAFVLLGPSGLGNPCTVQPSLCSPSGGTCPPVGQINGYAIDVAISATPGAGVVLPADGTSASDMASTWFVPGGMTATGGICGLGDYALQDLHSIDETQSDPTGNGVNPSGGFQAAGSGPIQEAITSMASSVETWNGNLVNVVADSGTGMGVEVGNNGGGAMNGRNLAVGSGAATLGVELRDSVGATMPNIGIVGASFTPLPNPGIPVLGGNLLVVPDALFTATAGVWQGPVTPVVFTFTSEGAMAGVQLAVPSTAGGAYLYIEGGRYSLSSFLLDTTGKLCICLMP